MNDIFFLFQQENLVYLWLIFAVIFMFSELGTPGLFVFIAFSIGCIAAAVFAFFKISFSLQCILGLIVTIITFLLLRHFFAVKYKSHLKTNIDALVGKTGIVIKAIEPNQFGSVKINGEIWAAESDNNLFIKEKSIIRVVLVKGNRLVVKI